MSFSALKKIFFLFILIFLMSGCEAEKAPPSELFFDLKSYSSIDDVKSMVGKNGGEWQVIERNELSGSDKRPPYEYVRVVTDIFKDSEFLGDSILVFYNDQLMAVWFYPNDWEGYKKYISAERGVDVRKEDWEIASGNTRNWIAKDYTGKHYIAWEDVILSNSMKEWLAKYS